MLAGVASSTAAILPTSASASLRKSPWNIWARGRGWGEGPGEARAAGSSGARVRVRHQDLKRETPVVAQQGLDGVEVEHELREAAGSVRLGQMLIPWQRQEGAASHLRERGLSSLVWCLQRGEDPTCGQDKHGGQQTGALVASGTAQPGVLIPRPGVMKLVQSSVPKLLQHVWCRWF